jgi:sugar transferase EpsL
LYAKCKRLLDVFFAVILLILSALPMALIALCVLAEGGGTVLFKQSRLGLHGKCFTCYKFRTMRAENAAGEPDMNRVTALGRVLRRFSLDELPQFWNILKGDMSFVGPRPLLPIYKEYYSNEQSRRHLTRPGMTGWAQINGRNTTDWTTRLQLDCWYVDNISPSVDCKIVLCTIKQLLTGSGVNSGGNVTMESFADYSRRQTTAR